MCYSTGHPTRDHHPQPSSSVLCSSLSRKAGAALLLDSARLIFVLDGVMGFTGVGCSPESDIPSSRSRKREDGCR